MTLKYWLRRTAPLTVLLLLVSCASYNATVFRTTNIAVDTTYATVKAFNTYYNAQSVERQAELLGARDEVYRVSRDVALTADTIETLRLEYEKNSSETNKISIDILLATLDSKASNVAYLVQHYLNK